MNRLKAFINYKFYLMKAFNFEPWHVSRYKEREYAQFLVKALNKNNNKGSVLEIGCGLGDILMRLEFDHKTGIDISPNVIKAAKFLSLFRKSKNTEYRYFVQDITSRAIDGDYNVIILVNWIHNIESKELKKILKDLYCQNLIIGGTLVFDIVKNSNYKFLHNAEYLIEGLNCHYDIIGPFEYGRYLVMCQKY